MAILSFIVNLIVLGFYVFTLFKINSVYIQLGAPSPSIVPQLLLGLPFVILAGFSFLNWRKQRVTPTRRGGIISLILIIVPVVILALLIIPSIALGPRSY